MNTLQRLCVVCSKCNECAMEVECLKYCDPNIVLVDSASFRRNALIVIYLYREVYPELCQQNRLRTSMLTLYMEMLLRCLYEDVVNIDEALGEYGERRDRDAYYNRVLRLDRCNSHDTIEIRFTEKVVLSVSLSTLNDVERLLCKLNCVYGTLNPDRGLEICRRLLSLLGKLCGISPVAAPESYVESGTCLQCYEEQATVPNQGRSITKRLQGLLCDHITVRKFLVQLETDIQTTEQDILETMDRTPRICGIISAIKNLSSLSPVSHSYINEAEEALRTYNLFTEIPEQIYSLSDFTYWSKTSEIIVKHVGVTVHQLNLYHGLCKALRDELSSFLYGENVVDVFEVGENRLAEDERLFVGSVFASPGKVVDLVTSMSIKTFEENPIFNRLHESNESYAKIRSLIEEIRRPVTRTQVCSGSEGGEGSGRGLGDAENEARGQEEAEGGAGFAAALERGDPLLKQHDMVKEVNVRKRAYLRKVSEAGYNKVMRCIKSQENLITKLINVNLVGTVCFEALSKLMNGLLLRQRYVDGAGARDVGLTLSYDDHLYVVNNLVHRKLPAESLPTLGQQVYWLLNGPLFDHHGDYYPLPHNIDMAYACDNAGMLPHVKDDLVRCAEGTVYPNEWMVTKYKEFFKFTDVDDLNALQKMLWLHVRELVFSVALYNEAFGKQLTIKRVDDAIETDDGGDAVVLAYNAEWPLFMRVNKTLYRSKDVYLLLYLYLNGECGDSNDGACELEAGSEDTDVARGINHAERFDGSLYGLVRNVDGDDDLVPECLLQRHDVEY